MTDVVVKPVEPSAAGTTSTRRVGLLRRYSRANSLPSHCVCAHARDCAGSWMIDVPSQTRLRGSGSFTTEVSCVRAVAFD